MKLTSCLAVVVIAMIAATARACGRELNDRIDASLNRARKFLVSRQDADGAWRSKTYGIMKDGASLTPHVLTTLYFIANDDASRDSFARGKAWLTSLRSDLIFPVYSSAEISWVMEMGASSPDSRDAKNRWLEFLRNNQLNAANGWIESDPDFGGWGYCPVIPVKPDAGGNRPPMLSSNLSATIFALGALRFAHAPSDDPAFRDALLFVLRCQNFDTGETSFDDGGFFFCPDDAAKNKPGISGIDSRGRTRFHSYGSMTCDGVRALLACGLPRDHPRVVAAKRWLEKHFTVTSNPGDFERDREVIRDATYYYYCWSLAHALTRLQIDTVDDVNWREALANELISRQRDDGSWINRFTDTKEDDPLTATPFAAAALAVCREGLAKPN